MVKRRKKRTLLLKAIILLALIVVAVFFAQQFMFNNIDQEEKAVIDEEVEQITQSIIDEIQKSDLIEDMTAARAEIAESEPTPEEGVAGALSQGEDAASRQPAAEEDKTASIIASYENGFKNLEDKGNGTIDRLLEELKVEYHELRASDGGKVDIGKLAASYTSKAKAYESSFDAGVAMLLAKMSEDLKSAGMADDEVENYIKRLENEYVERKKDRQNLMMEMANQYL